MRMRSEPEETSLHSREISKEQLDVWTQVTCKIRYTCVSQKSNRTSIGNGGASS